MKKENSISRRSFLKSTAMAGALGAIGTGSASVLTSCAGGSESAAANKPLKEPGTYYIPELPDKATDGKELKAGVIGCGGRGSIASLAERGQIMKAGIVKGMEEIFRSM